MNCNFLPIGEIHSTYSDLLIFQREFQNEFRKRSFLSKSNHPEFSSAKQIKPSTINCFAENWHEQFGAVCGKLNLFVS